MVISYRPIYPVAEGEGGAVVRERKSHRDVIDGRVVGAGEQVRAGDDVMVSVRGLVPASVARQRGVRARVQQLERFLVQSHHGRIAMKLET